MALPVITANHNAAPQSLSVEELFARQFVFHTMKNRVAALKEGKGVIGYDDAFIVADMGEICRKYRDWKAHLGRVIPHYAVKCNPDPGILELLADMGTGFDCASLGEIELVLSLGVSPDRIIYANPAKHPDHLRRAYSLGVTQTVFDNEDELLKLKMMAPNAEIFLRIMVDDTSSLCRLSQKYGAPLDTTAELLDLAKSLGVNLVGVSFHCGSGVSDPTAFTKAVKDARTVFDQAKAKGFDLKALDVGGGFTGEGFVSMADTLNKALEENFAPDIRIIGEPGRYFVSSAFSVACQVIARRVEKDPTTLEKRYKIYVNDGVYGNFASLIYDHQQVTPQILWRKAPGTEPTAYSVWGQTCDGLDKLNDKVMLPGILNIGDWVFFENMGAYTHCCATKFNGFSNDHLILYIYANAVFCDFSQSLDQRSDGVDQVDDIDRLTQGLRASGQPAPTNFEGRRPPTARHRAHLSLWTPLKENIRNNASLPESSQWTEEELYIYNNSEWVAENENEMGGHPDPFLHGTGDGFWPYPT